MRTPVFFAAVFLLASAPSAQELDCTVSINRATLQGDEYTFLDDIQEDATRYLNDRAWTEDRWQDRERIACSIQIAFTEAEGLTTFRGEIVAQAFRPIYGTGQRTTLFLISDGSWDFTYTRGQALTFDPERYDSFLSVLDFYAFLILGYDYDSFSELGGTPYFEQARRIAERARSSAGAVGWGSEFGSQRSRFELIRELLDPAFLPLRRAHFDYHFGVLDQFLVDEDVAWERATESLRALNELYLQFNQRRYASDVFFTAKYQELTRLYAESPLRNEAYALLSEMDPAHLSTYDALISGR
ncbi:MAG: DUF4835 family protein [Bacteroidota bacterium]